MKYIINLTISFDLDSRKLSLYNDERIFIELTKPATRLLMELIKNNQVNIAREELLNNVWLNYGFSASNAGLNNYISELRKSLVTLEMNREVIITIPKVGFRLDADIQTIAKVANKEIADVKIEPERSEDTQEKISPPEPERQGAPPKEAEKSSEAENKQPEQETHLPVITIPNRSKISLRVKTLLFAIPSILIIFLVMGTNADNQAQKTFLYNEGECQVSTLGPDKGTENMVSRAKAKIAELKIDCHSTKNDIFYIEERPGNNVGNKVFIAVCNRISNNKYSSCKNFKNS
ncbi:winged helix-turn-helix domain-containing protein [Serratia proteamaculans]|uniref:transcriptional regulator n=1 Tax=Serratia proteamaculans TaxID=28151 RepID=UPI0039B033C8